MLQSSRDPAVSSEDPAMAAGHLTSRAYWRRTWSGVELPHVTRPSPDVRRILRDILPRDASSLLEVGCAPGGWMAFFWKEFGHRVHGIEYVPESAELARRNLDMLGAEAEVTCGDFFEIESSSEYEIVFSAGFIEHFVDTDDVVARITNLATRNVVTLVPNLFGINGAICRVVRRDVYDKHVRLDPETLRRAHEKAGLRTRFCGYAGGIRLINVAAGNPFFERHPHIAASINRPVDYLNRFLRMISEWVPAPMSSRWWSPSVLYLGERVLRASWPTHSLEDGSGRGAS